MDRDSLNITYDDFIEFKEQLLMHEIWIAVEENLIKFAHSHFSFWLIPHHVAYLGYPVPGAEPKFAPFFRKICYFSKLRDLFFLVVKPTSEYLV